jgi:hypothetical protein
MPTITQQLLHKVDEPSLSKLVRDHLANWNGFAATRLELEQSTPKRPLKWASITRPAPLFMRSLTGRGPPMSYRRFWSAAERIRFAVADLPATGAQVWLKVGNEQLTRVQTILCPAEVND